MFAPLTEAGRTAVHEASLELLAEAGIALEHAEARRLLAGRGADVDGDIVRLPRDLVADALSSAPSSFTWRARNPDHDLTVGEGEPVVAPGSGARYVTRHGGDRRPATMDDFELFVKLCQAEDAIDCVGYDLCCPEAYALPGDPGGFDEAAVGYELLAGLVRLSDKPLVGSTRGADDAAASLAVARIAFDDPDLAEPYVAGVVTARSPRRWNEPIVDGLLPYAREGQPLAIGSGAIVAASAPNSLGETLVLANAEALFGVALAQAANPGTPVVLGYSGAAYDPRAETVAYGGPTTTVLGDLAAEMGAFYDLPARANGGLTDAKALDDQAGSESALQLAGALDSGADLVMNVAGKLDTGATASPEKFVLDCERVRLVREVARERAAVADRAAAGISLEVLRDIDPGETFYDDRTPADAAGFVPEVAIREPRERWAVDGETLGERARGRVDALLDAHERPPLDADVARDLESYVRERDGGTG